jgi:hypothetical protein
MPANILGEQNREGRETGGGDGDGGRIECRQDASTKRVLRGKIVFELVFTIRTKLL